MADRTFTINGLSVPRMLYGTAWKEERTRPLTELALQQGFHGIDTANQRCHYFEAAVGEGIRAVLDQGLLRREDLFLQTKYTFQRGQDERLPYDPKADIATQVEQSFSSSQEHLGVKTIDSYVLHGPSIRDGLADDDWNAWRAMERLFDQGHVRFLGVSNVNLKQLQELCRDARARPTFVQNRCYASRGWDARVREFCTANGLIYQGFSLLTANRKVIAKSEIKRIAKRHARSVNQVIFRFALEVGMQPLTGTSDPAHMREDLDAFEFRLDPEEVTLIKELGLEKGT